MPRNKPVSGKRSLRESPNDPQRDIVIPVVGPTGCGKSSFINALLQHNDIQMTVGHEQESCTTEIFTAVVDSSQIPFRRECLKNRRLILVDNPGFDSTDLYDWDVLEKIVTCLQQSYRDYLLLGGVIYLQDISLDRVSGATKRCLDMLNKACGVDGLKNVVLVATKWSRLSPNEPETRFRRLKEVHWKSMVDMGAQAFRIDEGGSSPASLINAILERFEEGILLAVQHEIIDDNKSLSKTGVWKQTLKHMARWKRFLHRIFPFEF